MPTTLIFLALHLSVGKRAWHCSFCRVDAADRFIMPSIREHFLGEVSTTAGSIASTLLNAASLNARRSLSDRSLATSTAPEGYSTPILWPSPPRFREQTTPWAVSSDLPCAKALSSRVNISANPVRTEQFPRKSVLTYQACMPWFD